MANEIMEPGSINRDSLRELFESAYVDVSVDEDGDLVVTEQFNVFVMPAEGGAFVHLLAVFAPDEQAAEEEKIRFANTWNDRWSLVRCCVDQRGRFVFDHYIWAEGGLTRKNLVQSLKAYQLILAQGLSQSETDGILA